MSQNEETKSAVSDFWSQVEARLKDTADVVNQRMMDFYVEEEVTARAELLKKGFAKSREAKRELQKMKPDQKARALDGSLVEQWSTEAWEKKQKAVEALTKLEKALETALAGKYEDLKKVLG